MSGGGGLGTLTFAEVLGWIRDIGTIAVLSLIVWGALQEWWVTGVQFRRVLAERDAFREELFSALGLADRATNVSDRATTVADRATSARRGGPHAPNRLEAERDVRRRRTDT